MHLVPFSSFILTGTIAMAHFAFPAPVSLPVAIEMIAASEVVGGIVPVLWCSFLCMCRTVGCFSHICRKSTSGSFYSCVHIANIRNTFLWTARSPPFRYLVCSEMFRILPLMMSFVNALRLTALEVCLLVCTGETTVAKLLSLLGFV